MTKFNLRDKKSQLAQTESERALKHIVCTKVTIILYIF